MREIILRFDENYKYCENNTKYVCMYVKKKNLEHNRKLIKKKMQNTICNSIQWKNRTIFFLVFALYGLFFRYTEIFYFIFS